MTTAIVVLVVLACMYVVASVVVATWLYIRGEVSRYERNVSTRILFYIASLALWPFLLAMIRSMVIEFEADKRKKQETMNKKEC